MTLNFETTKCSRCSGKGFGDWATEHGRCFKCSGKGSVLTGKGKAAKAAYIAARLVPATVADLQVGDVLAGSDSWGRLWKTEVTSLVPHLGRIVINGEDLRGLTEAVQVWKD